MARLPLIINGQRLKTLEELRKNFNLTELIERYKGGQLRAWLNCWDFSSEQEQLEALSPDLPEQEQLEALCRIFGVEGEAKERALTAFKEEREKLEEQQREVERLRKLHEQEEQRRAEQTKPLALDEIEFDWQEAEGPKIDLLTSGADRFVAIADKRGYYSYNGIQWERANIKWEENYVCRLSCCNGNFILDYNGTHYVYSNFTRWDKIEIGDKIHINKIIWTGDHYIALGSEEYQSSYETGTFFKKTETHWVCNPIIYTSDELTGPWHRETVDLNGVEYISDGVWFNNRLFAFCGTPYETIIYSGSTLTDLTRHKEEGSGCGVRVWTGMGKCFRGLFTVTGGFPEGSALVTDDGIHWKALKYGIEQFADANRFIIAHLFILKTMAYAHDGTSIGFHVSLDGINWRKLNAPLQKGKIAYLDGKLLIADGNKLAVGTLKN